MDILGKYDFSHLNKGANEVKNMSVYSVTSTSSPKSLYITTVQNSEFTDTYVKYAFLTTAVLVLSAALPFLGMYLFNSKDPAVWTTEPRSMQHAYNLPQTQKYIVIFTMLVLSFLTTSCIMVFPNFLTTFVVDQLDWTQASAAALTSVFYATYCVGNVMGIFVLKFATTNKLITASYVGTIAVLSAFLIGSITIQYLVIWISVAVGGIGMAAIIPTIYTWTEENVTHVTGRIASGLLVCGSLGLIFQPFVLGILMDNNSNMWFIYFTLGGAIVCAMLYVFAFTIVKVFSRSMK